MPARHPRSDCLHGDTSVPYPVRSAQDWPLGEDTERDAALETLSAALMACRTPLASALAQLTPQDISRGLTATQLSRRPSVLRPLGLLITPRKIGQHLCRNILTRLTSADDYAARRAARALTNAVLIDIRMNVFADEFSERFSPRSRDPVNRWSAALTRVAVWANGLASVADARLWLGRAKQPWLRPDSVSDEEVAAIVAAAKSVYAASPGFRWLDEHDRSVGTDEPVGQDNQEVIVPGSHLGHPSLSTPAATPTVDADADADADVDAAMISSQAASDSTTADESENPRMRYRRRRLRHRRPNRLRRPGRGPLAADGRAPAAGDAGR